MPDRASASPAAVDERKGSSRDLSTCALPAFRSTAQRRRLYRLADAVASIVALHIHTILCDMVRGCFASVSDGLYLAGDEGFFRHHQSPEGRAATISDLRSRAKIRPIRYEAFTMIMA